MIALVVTLAAGCSQVLGFKDPRLGEDDAGASGAGVSDAGVSDDAALDGSVGGDGSLDAAMDSGAAPLWVFTTNGDARIRGHG